MRNLVLLVNPPNDDQRTQTGRLDGQYREHTDWANMPHAGLLSVCSFLASKTKFEPVYFDGTVLQLDVLFRFLKDNAPRLKAIGVSMLSANSQSAIDILRTSREIDPDILTLAGNDHASFFADSIIRSHRDSLDAIFIGDSTFTPLQSFLDSTSVQLDRISEPVIFQSSQISEFPAYDFDIIDRHFHHNNAYQSNFVNGVGAAIHHRLGLRLRSAIPIHIAQGCLKFVAKDPCSFCSIFPGTTGRAHLTDVRDAWSRLFSAIERGFDYLYVTADELPQTFPHFLAKMHSDRPEWARKVFGEKRALLVGYARADGLANRRSVDILKDIGFGLLMVGFDAFHPGALAALGKGMRLDQDRQIVRQKMALRNCRDAGLHVKAGLVIGHFGASESDIRRQVMATVEIIREFPDVMFSVDVEILSPEPGSRDFLRLTDHTVAAKDAQLLGMRALYDQIVAGMPRPRALYTGRSAAILEYASSLMLGVSADLLIEARGQIRDAARSAGIHVAE